MSHNAKLLKSYQINKFYANQIDNFDYKDISPKIKEKITFDDHHQYTIEDIDKIEGTIITTEKDAVKLALLGKTNIFALKLKTVLDVETLLK